MFTFTFPFMFTDTFNHSLSHTHSLLLSNHIYFHFHIPDLNIFQPVFPASILSISIQLLFRTHFAVGLYFTFMLVLWKSVPWAVILMTLSFLFLSFILSFSQVPCLSKSKVGVRELDYSYSLYMTADCWNSLQICRGRARSPNGFKANPYLSNQI